MGLWERRGVHVRVEIGPKEARRSRIAIASSGGGGGGAAAVGEEENDEHYQRIYGHGMADRRVMRIAEGVRTVLGMLGREVPDGEVGGADEGDSDDGERDGGDGDEEKGEEEEEEEEEEVDEDKEEKEEEEDEYAPTWPPRWLNTLIPLLSLPALFHYMYLLFPFPVSSHGQGF